MSTSANGHPARVLLQPAAALIVAALLLPAVLLSFAAVYSYRETLEEAETRVDRTARILEEHAVKVFETHRLAIQEIQDHLRFMDFSRESDRADLHKMLLQLQTELPQISTITIADAQGRMEASGRMYPADPKITFADRDYFQALKIADPSIPYVSRAYPGRTSNIPIFNLANRTPDGPDHAFTGTIAVSVNRAYFESFYKTIEPTYDHTVVLVREDGVILASDTPLTATVLSPASTLLAHIKESPTGSYTAPSRIDGVERIFAYRKVGAYPVYVRFGIAKQAALAPWRSALLTYGIVAALATLALVAASMLAVRQTHRERVARRLWQETATQLRVQAAAREEIEAQLRQSQKMEVVGRLTGGVAHDFNNLLTAVIGSLDLVRRRPTGIDDRNTNLIANALEGAQRAAALVARLLAFSRQQPLQPVQVDANMLVTGMSDLLRRTLGEMVVVETVLAPGIWPTLADPNQLESALLNLAVNARDAMPDGGRLTIETDNAVLDEAYAKSKSDVAPGHYVMIAVSDTGTGMTPEVVSQVFEPFFTTKPVGKGTGLGLSQVYGFVKQSGGHVAIYSEVGHGSSFKIYLPRAHGPMREPLAPVLPPALPDRLGHGERILVVEDEEMVRRLTVAALQDAGYSVIEAADGPQGLDLLRRHADVRLLFTDVVLAGPMNGRVLADAILKERPGLPVLFTTGYTRNAIIHHGRLDEGVNFIGKPFTSASLVAKVHDLLKAGEA